MKGSKAMANENKLQEIIAASLENIRSMVDANTVIGNPINTPQGTTIIPVSKVSLGFASGGLDYAGKSEEAVRARLQNFGGGGIALRSNGRKFFHSFAEVSWNSSIINLSK